MEEIGNRLIEQAGPVGAALGVMVLAAGAVMARMKGWLGFGPPKDEPKGEKAAGQEQIMAELRTINGRLGSFDERLSEVEHDLASRPTRQDMHRLELSLARMDERLAAVTGKVDTTNAGVQRIENFLLELSRKGK